MVWTNFKQKKRQKNVSNGSVQFESGGSAHKLKQTIKNDVELKIGLIFEYQQYYCYSNSSGIFGQFSVRVQDLHTS